MFRMIETVSWLLSLDKNVKRSILETKEHNDKESKTDS